MDYDSVMSSKNGRIIGHEKWKQLPATEAAEYYIECDIYVVLELVSECFFIYYMLSF